jgi:hypothetical protein
MTGIRALVLLSGPMAVGKTTLRQELIMAHGFAYVRSGSFLVARAEQEGWVAGRTDLQDLGDALDLQTDYRWLLDDVAFPSFSNAPEKRRWLIDAVRKERQIEHFRAEFGSAVLHVHLTAPKEVLRLRYERRAVEGEAATSITPYEIAASHANELASRSLIELADMVVDTSQESAQAAADRVGAAIGKLDRA